MKTKEEVTTQILELLNGFSYEEIFRITLEIREIAREKSKLSL